MRLLILSAIAIAAAFVAAPVAQARPAQGQDEAFIDRFCSDHGETARHARFEDWLVRKLGLTDAQKLSFDDFESARAKSLFDSKAALCSSKPDLSTFEARLAFGQTFLKARMDALETENPKLIAFYKSLDDKQQERFDAIRARLPR